MSIHQVIVVALFRSFLWVVSSISFLFFGGSITLMIHAKPWYGGLSTKNVGAE
jgi:hypothetical protein